MLIDSIFNYIQGKSNNELRFELYKFLMRNFADPHFYPHFAKTHHKNFIIIDKDKVLLCVTLNNDGRRYYCDRIDINDFIPINAKIITLKQISNLLKKPKIFYIKNGKYYYKKDKMGRFSGIEYFPDKIWL
jgi:hypothetical protein